MHDIFVRISYIQMYINVKSEKRFKEGTQANLVATRNTLHLDIVDMFVLFRTIAYTEKIVHKFF